MKTIVRFTFIIGSDQLATFHKWGRWQKLLMELPFLVFPRAGYALTPLYPGMRVLSHPLLVVTNISSTLVRERISQNLPVTHLLPERVAAYITRHQLYK